MRQLATLLPYMLGLLACEFVPPMGMGSGMTLGGTDGTSDDATVGMDAAATDDASTVATSTASDDTSADDTGDCPSGTLGCPCDAGTCDRGLICREGECVLETCGDDNVDRGEECDDNNNTNGDGCETNCSRSPGAAKVVTGAAHTCALLWTGHVRCWGSSMHGQLGYGSDTTIGDDEEPWTVGNVPIGGSAIDLSAGSNFTCALLADHNVRCWGDGAAGRLGNGDTKDYGGDEHAADSPLVQLGRPAVQITSGEMHSCALLDDESVVCWGEAAQGRLGYGDNQDIGDGEPANSKGPVPIGGAVAQIAAGGSHTCALLTNGNMRCWGDGNSGRLGYGDTDSFGDGSLPSDAGDVPIGAPVSQIATGFSHTCAVLMSGHALCWGVNSSGQLGDGTDDPKGDEMGEKPEDLELIELGGMATAIAAGREHTCALLENGTVKCWGKGDTGRLGYGSTDGTLLPPPSPVIVSTEQSVLSISLGDTHTCARLDEGNLRCWGSSMTGQLGYGDMFAIGDEAGETPESAGDVPFLP
jgi:cysteine-rich repeat protein